MQLVFQSSRAVRARQLRNRQSGDSPQDAVSTRDANWWIPRTNCNYLPAMHRLLTSLLAFVLPTVAMAAPVEIIPPELRGTASQPQVAIADDGHVHVVFGSTGAIFHTSSADGRSFSPPVKVGAFEKLALGKRRGPRIAVSGMKLVIAAISYGDGDVHCWTSPDAGRTWKEDAPINTVRGSAREGLHALAGDGRGLVAVVWLDLRVKGTTLRGRVSRDGGVSWGDDVEVYRSPDGHICECCVPNVAVSDSGEITAMWRNWLGGSRDLYVSTSRDGGRSFSPAEKLGSGTWKLNACPMDGGTLALGGAGEWLAVWRRERTVYASMPGTPERLLGKEAAQPVAILAGKTPVMLWEDAGGLMLQRGEGAPARFAANATFASIAGGKGAPVVVWESGSGRSRTIMCDRVQ
jgi:hypothetical protein